MFYDDDTTDPASEAQQEQENNAGGLGGTRNKRGERVGSACHPVIKSRADVQHNITMIHGQIGFIRAVHAGHPDK